ncbi:MAG: hypothetical protein ACR2QM_13710 [Longimicrobiales bacterium]
MTRLPKPPLGLVLVVLLITACQEGASPFGAESDQAVAFTEGPAAIVGPPEITNDLSAFGVSGARFVADGVALAGLTAGSITVNVPAGAAVQSAILYWGARGNLVDPCDILVDQGGAPTPVTGVYIGQTTSGQAAHSFRVDLIAAGLTFGPGANTVNLTVPADEGIEGATLVITFDDGNTGSLELRDGNDFAYLPRAEQTNLQTFNFPADAAPRDATLLLVVGDVEGMRPNRIVLNWGTGDQEFINALGDGNPGREGEEWDNFSLDVTIPPGTTSVSAQLFSHDDLSGLQPASLYWVAGALEVLDPPPPPSGGEGCTPGYWKQSHHFDSWVGHAPDDEFSSVFDNAFPGMTLLNVLKQGGGGLKALGRHTVAALLNGASDGVDYDLSEVAVIAAFNDVFPGSKSEYNAQKDVFADFNEQGCPLN